MSEWPSQFPYNDPTEARTRRWCPALGIDNLAEVKEREDWMTVDGYERDGITPLPAPQVRYRTKLTGQFRERFEMQSFPFDSQDLQIKLISAHAVGTQAAVPTEGACSNRGRRSRLTDDPGRCSTVAPISTHQDDPDVSLVPNTEQPLVVNLNDFPIDAEYVLSPSILSIRSLTDPDLSQSGRRYPFLTFALKVARKPAFYIFNVVLPVFLLVVMAFTAYLLGPEALSDKLGIIMTAITVHQTYKLYVGEQIPKVSYLTLLDIYMAICYTVLFLMGMSTALVYWLNRTQDSINVDSLNVLEDDVAKLAMCIWVLGHGVIAYKYYSSDKYFINLCRKLCPQFLYTNLESAVGSSFSWRSPEEHGGNYSEIDAGSRIHDVMGHTSPDGDTVLLHHSRQHTEDTQGNCRFVRASTYHGTKVHYK